MLKFVITLVLLGIVVYCTWRGYKNGIVRGVCGIIAILLALYGAGIAADMFSEEFEGVMSPFVSGMIDSAADKVKNGDEKATVKLTEAQKADVYSFSYACARQLGLVDSAAKTIGEETAAEYHVVNPTLYEGISAKLCSRFANVAVFMVAFAILAIIFAVIGNVVNLSFLIPKLGVVEPILGAILGLIRGLMLMYTITILFRYLGIILPGSLMAESGLLFKLVNDNPVANRVGL